MDTSTGLIAVIPVFKALPAGVSVDKSILFARNCPEIVKTYVLTDFEEVARSAGRHGAAVFPAKSLGSGGEKGLTGSVLRDVVEKAEHKDGETYRYVLVLDAQRPLSNPFSVLECFQRMMIDGDVAGIADANRSLHMTRIDDLKDDPAVFDEMKRHMVYVDENLNAEER